MNVSLSQVSFSLSLPSLLSFSKKTNKKRDSSGPTHSASFSKSGMGPENLHSYPDPNAIAGLGAPP